MSSSTNDSVTNVAVIVRSSGERTEQLCVRLVKQQVPEEHVVVIHERPFSQALRRGFEIGIDFDLEWTVCLDADILLRPNALQTLVTLIEQQPTSVLGGHGRILDKFFGRLRYAGPHLYRTSLLDRALQYIPDADVSLRPETHVKKLMSSQGHGWAQFDQVMAVHDFEQYYRDIYRKMIVRANKGPEQVGHLLFRAQAHSRADTDFLVCLWGLRVGMARDEDVKLDAYQWNEEIGTLLLAHGLQEKCPLTIEESLSLPEKLYWRFLVLHGLYEKTPGLSPLRLQRSLLWRLGWILESMGVRFRLWGAR